MIDAARSEDKRARHLFKNYNQLLGAGLINPANLFIPQRIVIGGGFSLAGELILGPARHHRRLRDCPYGES